MYRNEDVLADLHTHTIFSAHAYSTIEECIAAAEKAGMKYLAVTDHYYGDGTALDKKNEVSRLKYLERDINSEGDRVYVIGGSEFNLGQFPEQWEKLRRLSWKLIGLHSFFMSLYDQTLEGLYQMFRESSDYFDAFAHIERSLHKIDSCRYSNQLTPEIKDFLERVVVLAGEKNIVLELNEASSNRVSSGTAERQRYWLNIARENGNRVCLGSDAHYSGRIGVFTNTLKLLNETDYPRELVLNFNEDQLQAIIGGIDKITK